MWFAENEDRLQPAQGLSLAPHSTIKFPISDYPRDQRFQKHWIFVLVKSFGVLIINILVLSISCISFEVLILSIGTSIGVLITR